MSHFFCHVIVGIGILKVEFKKEMFLLKINQFAHLKVSHQQKVNELTKIHFLKTNDQQCSLNDLFITFLQRAFVEAQSPSIFKQKLHTLLATPTQDLKDFLEYHQLTVDVFYTVAMQLLGFEVHDDFECETVRTQMKEDHIFHYDQLQNNDDLIDAWYDLLCTHGKNGRTYLDTLAARGFFQPFWNLPTDQKPLLFNGKVQPVFDPSKLIREVVYVESSLDTDHDGKRDLLKTEILRPAETNDGLRVPVLYTASPYNQGTNDQAADRLMHNVDVPLKHKQPNNLTYKDIEFHHPTKDVPPARPVNGETHQAEETFGTEKAVTLNNYFLTRGFAAVYAAGIGTMDSDGERTCGTQEETESTIAIIEWLAGNRRAFTNKTDNLEIKAWWCNGSVAMTGKSYLGTLATAAATTGVAGLKTVISEAAISSWYDYYRDGGLVIAPGGFPGEDADVLAEECFSRQKQAGDYLKCQNQFNSDLKKITKGQDRDTGDYNSFWDARNYLKNVANIQCDIVMVHGLNDWNVKPRNVYHLYHELEKLPVTKKLFLHQGQHIYINNFQSIDFTDMMNLWLTNKLYGIDNHADELLPDVCVQDNSVESTWHTYKGWHTDNPTKLNFNFEPNKLVKHPVDHSTVAFNDQLKPADFNKYKNNWELWRNDLLSSAENALHPSRLIFKTTKITNDLYLQGCPHIQLKVASSMNKGMLSFMLVDFGNARRLKKNPSILGLKELDSGYRWRPDDLKEFKLDKPTPWKMITKGHINLQNRENPWKTDELLPNNFYSLQLDLQPMFYHLLKGHQLGLAIYSTDMEMTVRGNEDITYTLQLDNCQLSISAEALK